MDAIFNENRFSSVPRPSLRILNGTEDDGGSVVPEKVTEQVVQQPEPKIRKSKRTMKSQDVTFWKEAINDEMDSIMGNNTWVLVDLPLGCKPLGCKWIFKRKLKIDLKIAFLSCELENEIYMNQPHGFIMPGNENKVNLTKEFLSSRFFLKDMKEADVILGDIPTISSHSYYPNSQKKMDHQYPILAKIPVLDTGKFEQWQFRILQYLQLEHYALWEVIEFDDSYKVPANADPAD
nr:zinc finger, CCHC-type [Tanacetum cinerariifolium]